MSTSDQLLRLLEPAVRPTGAPGPAARPRPSVEHSSFEQLLDSARGPLRISAHAQTRLTQQGVALEGPRMAAISDAVMRAEAKGARDALVMMGDLGLIVNVPNRTVVTAMTSQRMREGVVTDIDSAIVVADPELNRTSEKKTDPLGLL